MKGVKIKFNTMSTKYVYTFGDGKAEGKADMKNLLGGKGANLAEMNLICLHVRTADFRAFSLRI